MFTGFLLTSKTFCIRLSREKDIFSCGSDMWRYFLKAISQYIYNSYIKNSNANSHGRKNNWNCLKTRESRGENLKWIIVINSCFLNNQLQNILRSREGEDGWKLIISHQNTFPFRHSLTQSIARDTCFSILVHLNVCCPQLYFACIS